PIERRLRRSSPQRPPILSGAAALARNLPPLQEKRTRMSVMMRLPRSLHWLGQVLLPAVLLLAAGSRSWAQSCPTEAVAVAYPAPGALSLTGKIAIVITLT